MAWTAGFLGVLRHHRAQRLDAGCQAKAPETRRHLLEYFTHSFDRWRGESCCCCANCLHGVAFLLWNQHPSLQAQGEQRRPSFFNIERDIPLRSTAITLAAATAAQRV